MSVYIVDESTEFLTSQSQRNNNNDFQNAQACLLWTAGVVSFLACIWIVVHRAAQDDTLMTQLPNIDYSRTKEPYVTNRTGAVTCDTEDCRYMRWLLGVAVDTRKDPCRNFYEYACSGVDGRYRHWFAGSSRGTLGLIESNLTSAIFNSLSHAAVPSAAQTAFQKAAAFYQLCTRPKDVEIEKESFNRLVVRYQLLLFAPRFQPLSIFVHFLIRLQLFAVFALSLEPGSHVLSLRRSDEFLWWREKRLRLIQENRYEDYVREAIAWTETPSAANVMKITNAEDEAMRLAEEKHSDGSKREMLPLSQLGLWRNDSALSAEWVQLLRLHTSRIFPGNFSITAKREDLGFFHDLFGSHGQINATDLRTYIVWAVLNQLRLSAALGGVTEKEYCKRTVLRLFPYSAMSATLYRTVNKHRIDGVRAVVETIARVVHNSLREATWLDTPTRAAALDKLSKMKISYAYPPYLTDKQEVEEFYKKFRDVRDSFLDAFVEASYVSAAYHLYLMKNANPESVSDYFVFSETHRTSTVYLPHMNTLYIRAGIMHKPAYTYGGPPEVNYGALGREVAAGILRGFVGNGQNFDGSGRLVNWWTSQSHNAFVRREKCVRELYENMTVGDEHKIDAMGERLAYLAYKEAQKTTSVRLAGSLTGDQLFYVSWCLIFCGETSTHSSGQMGHRCNVPLMNSDQFSNAFSCPANTPMNPRTKCRFW